MTKITLLLSIILCVLPVMAAHNVGVSAPTTIARPAAPAVAHVGNPGVQKAFGFRSGNSSSKAAVGTARANTSSTHSVMNITNVTNTNISTTYRNGGCCGWLFPVTYYGLGYYPGFVYYPGLFYPTPVGFFFGINFHRDDQAGIKLDLGSIHGKVDRRDAEDSEVFFSTDGQSWNQIGRVAWLSRHVWHEEPGDYVLKINLPNGPLIIPVEVREHEVTHVAVTTDRPPQVVALPQSQPSQQPAAQQAEIAQNPQAAFSSPSYPAEK